MIATRHRAFLMLLCCGILAAQEYRFPADAGMVDVTKPPYSAVGDGMSDDTQAIQRAITDNVGKWRIIYLPAGTYLVSDTLRWQMADGNWAAMLKIQGECRDRTIIRLVDHAPGFQQPGDVRGRHLGKPVIQTASGLGWVDHNNQPARQQKDPNGNMAFGNSLFDLTIETGTGNPGAVGIDFVANNWGMLDRIVIRSGDGQGFCGLSFLRMLPGPCLAKRVRIEGFRYGIAARWMDYSVVLEDIELSGQSEAGIWNSTNALSIVGLRSDNRVPAIVMEQQVEDGDGWGLITLVDAELAGGEPQRHAIEGNGNWYMRNVRSSGYAAVSARIDSGSEVAEWSNSLLTSDSAQAGMQPLALPLEPAPEWHSNDFSQWANVMDFGAIPGDEQCDSAALQAAIDSGKPIIYFPNIAPDAPHYGSWWAARKAYTLTRPIEVRGAVRKLVGCFSELRTSSGMPDGTPILIIADGTAPEVIIDGLAIHGNDGGPTLINTRRTVVIRNHQGNVSVGPEARRLHLIDIACGYVHLLHPVRAWLHQFNPESGAQTKLINVGGDVWVNGFKTEAFSACIDNRAGGRMEVLGGYMRAHGPGNHRLLDELLPMVRNENASLAFSCTTRANQEMAYPVEILDIRGGNTHWLLAEDCPRRSHPFESVIPRYISQGAPVIGVSPIREMPAQEALASGTVPWLEARSKWAGEDWVYLRITGGSDASLRFTADLSVGEHRVYLRWIENKHAAADVPVTIVHADGETRLRLDQRTPGAAWRYLGTFRADTMPLSVSLSASGTSGMVSCDAVRFVRADAIDPRLSLHLAVEGTTVPDSP